MLLLSIVGSDESQRNIIHQIIDPEVWWINPDQKQCTDVRIRVLPKSGKLKARIRIFGRFCNISKRITLPLPIKARELIYHVDECSQLNTLIRWNSKVASTTSKKNSTNPGNEWCLDRKNKRLIGPKTTTQLKDGEMKILLFLMCLQDSTEPEKKTSLKTSLQVSLQKRLGLSQGSKHALFVRIYKLRKILPAGINIISTGKAESLRYELVA